MILKHGFLLIELMIGLTLSLFLILIIAHYIIEVKNIQQGVIARIEALSLASSLVEQYRAHNEWDSTQVNNNKDYRVVITTEPFLLSDSSLLIPVKSNNHLYDKHTITVSWQLNKHDHSLSVSTISLSERKV